MDTNVKQEAPTTSKCGMLRTTYRISMTTFAILCATMFFEPNLRVQPFVMVAVLLIFCMFGAVAEVLQGLSIDVAEIKKTLSNK